MNIRIVISVLFGTIVLILFAFAKEDSHAEIEAKNLFCRNCTDHRLRSNMNYGITRSFEILYFNTLGLDCSLALNSERSCNMRQLIHK